MNRINEQWKPVEGYEGIYAVSDLGRVKSLKYNKEKILKPKKDNGYLRVQLWKNKKGKMLYIHRLVAEAFLPNPLGLPEVNHLDEVKTNDCVENLEWCTRRYNMNYGTIQERLAAARRNHPANRRNHHAKRKPVEASKFSDFREIELRFDSIIEVSRNGYNCGDVSACCRKCFNREGNNRYKGLYWRFAI